MNEVTTHRHEMEEALVALAADAGPGEDCPPAEEIWEAVRGEGTASRRRQVVDHMATCPACAEAWRLAVELTPRAETGAVRDSSPPVRHSASWWPAAMAAALLLAAGAAFLLLRSAPPEPMLRGGGEEIRSLVEGPLPRAGGVLLQWTAGPEGTLYDVVVSGEDLEVVTTVEGLTEAELVLTEAELAALPAGSRLLWRVEAQLPDGTRRASPTFTTRLE